MKQCITGQLPFQQTALTKTRENQPVLMHCGTRVKQLQCNATEYLKLGQLQCLPQKIMLSIYQFVGFAKGNNSVLFTRTYIIVLYIHL